ncbi:Uncharacterized conserved protein, DUF433 family [bacterium JGI 053]|nr:Uncharacterized conserved protein, DUF433 family [bacterium JGI 053]
MRGGRHSLRRVTRPELRRVVDAHPRIVRRTDVWGGKAVVEGTRVPVFMVHARLQSGWCAEEIRAAYPRLTAADVEAVVRYAQEFPARVLADRRAYERSLPLAGARTARMSRIRTSLL